MVKSNLFQRLTPLPRIVLSPPILTLGLVYKMVFVESEAQKKGGREGAHPPPWHPKMVYIYIYNVIMIMTSKWIYICIKVYTMYDFSMWTELNLNHINIDIKFLSFSFFFFCWQIAWNTGSGISQACYTCIC